MSNQFGCDNCATQISHGSCMLSNATRTFREADSQHNFPTYCWPIKCLVPKNESVRKKRNPLGSPWSTAQKPSLYRDLKVGNQRKRYILGSQMEPGSRQGITVRSHHSRLWYRPVRNRRFQSSFLPNNVPLHRTFAEESHWRNLGETLAKSWRNLVAASFVAQQLGPWSPSC